MKKIMNYDMFEITVLENEPCIADNMPVWIGVFYDDTYGIGDVGQNTLDAAVNCIEMVWRDQEWGGLEKTVGLIEALIALGVVPANFGIDNTCAVIDGKLWFGYANLNYPTKSGLQPWNSMKTYNIGYFNGVGKALAENLLKHAQEDAEEWLENYLEWEASWIDGLQ